MLTSALDTGAELRIAGVPAAGFLRGDRALREQLLGHVSGHGARAGAALPCGASWGEAAEVVGGCLELVSSALQDGRMTEVPSALSARIGDWAADGVALEAVQYAMHRGFRFVHDRLARHAGRADAQAVTLAGQRLAVVFDRVQASFTGAYLREVRTEHGGAAAIGAVLATALTSGAAVPATARAAGFPIADSYVVLALGLGDPHRDADRSLRRARTELAAARIPALLGVGGGTLLVPEGGDAAAREVFDRLRTTIGAPIRAGAVRAARGDVPEAARRAHELLELAERLERPSGIYLMADLAVEYQVSRPGPGRRQLAAVLAPLRAQPELLATLAAYLRYDRHRRRTSRALFIHDNTVDHRLRRIAALTGLDPMHVDGLWSLQAALVAHSYELGAVAPGQPIAAEAG
ncbi:PucR family transcriptional regulator [Nocardia harenae]|uniref:PucR family transcriptional regulator n=1 Tax=Nocardia harenae TaxID=358707 RepID=UPI000835E975|nr:helix-turn-helix domain-containing protein [Nocardia harenae]